MSLSSFNHESRRDQDNICPLHGQESVHFWEAQIIANSQSYLDAHKLHWRHDLVSSLDEVAFFYRDSALYVFGKVYIVQVSLSVHAFYLPKRVDQHVGIVLFRRVACALLVEPAQT